MTLWTEKREYITGEEIQIFFRANKPVYIRLLHIDAEGHILQLLPNPYRNQDRFLPDEVITVPGREDTFKLEVSPPFGIETIILYASTISLENIEIDPTNHGLFVSTRDSNLSRLKTNGNDLEPAEMKEILAAAEFSETRVEIKTRKG